MLCKKGLGINMITDYNTIIIGAGAAGLLAGCVTQGRTLILEKNNSPGKKLLISGAGQCNYTHYGDIEDFTDKYGENGRFLRHELFNFTNADAVEFFRRLSVESIIREDGKIFPKSLKASDIVNALVKKCKLNNTEIRYNSPVDIVGYSSETKHFTVKTFKERLTSKNIILSAGGCSYPNTGSGGDGFKLAAKLGHKITEISPCLTPAIIKNYSFADLSGLSFCNIKIALIRDNKKIKEAVGDVLLTHKSLSGPGILNLSRYICENDSLRLNFINLSREELTALIDKNTKENGKMRVRSIFRDINISKRFVEKIFSVCGVHQDIICSQLSKKDKTRLITAFCEHILTVESLGGYHLAMATRGGVTLNEINRKTMQSKIIQGLYFAGEVMNIDADTGGYNIQAAFSTAYAAASDINKNINN